MQVITDLSHAVAGGAESREISVDLVISTNIDEPLISDILAGKLEIAVKTLHRSCVSLSENC